MILAAHVNDGACVSFTVTVKLQVVTLLLASVTVNNMVVVPLLNVCALGWPLPLSVVAPVVLQLNTDPVQLSPNVTDGMVTKAVHTFASVDCVMFEAQVNEGACVSFMVTVKLQVVTLLLASVAVNNTVVVPLLKVLVPG